MHVYDWNLHIQFIIFTFISPIHRSKIILLKIDDGIFYLLISGVYHKRDVSLEKYL